MSAQTAVLDAAPPLSVATWLPKKYFSSKVPNGVRMYFCDVAQDQGAKRLGAVIEERLLAIDDGLGHEHDGVAALLDVACQRAGFLQLMQQVVFGSGR